LTKHLLCQLFHLAGGITEHFFLPILNHNHVMKNFHLLQQCSSALENENLLIIIEFQPVYQFCFVQLSLKDY